MDIKTVCIVDENNYYVGFGSVDENGNPAGYELKVGEKVLDVPLPNCTSDGVLYDETAMLRPKWDGAKWVETATEQEREAARFVPAETGTNKPLTLLEEVRGLKEKMSRLENQNAVLFAQAVNSGMELEKVPYDIRSDVTLEMSRNTEILTKGARLE